MKLHRPKEWFTLLEIARHARANGGFVASTVQLAQMLGISQQTASRRLHTLKKLGWVQSSDRKSAVLITTKGWRALREVFVSLEDALGQASKPLQFTGVVSSGWGDGKTYVTMKGYMRQFKEKLGYEPYPGTLNVTISHEDELIRQRIEREPAVRIDGFKEGDRTFGEVLCFPVEVNGVEGAMLNIRRTHHDKNVVEVISPAHLRKVLSLSDGDPVTVKHVPIPKERG